MENNRRADVPGQTDINRPGVNVQVTATPEIKSWIAGVKSTDLGRLSSGILLQEEV